MGRVWVSGGFVPGDSVVKNLPANAEDTSLIPGPGRSHIPGDSEAQAPQPLKPECQESCSTTREATAVKSPSTAIREKPQLTVTRGSPSAATRTQHSHKKKKASGKDPGVGRNYYGIRERESNWNIMYSSIPSYFLSEPQIHCLMWPR